MTILFATTTTLTNIDITLSGYSSLTFDGPGAVSVNNFVQHPSSTFDLTFLSVNM